MRYDQQQQPNYYGYGYIPAPQPQPSYFYPTPNEGIKTFFVNGIEGVKTFIMMPNQTVYLRDSDSNKLYEKKSDNTGRCEIKCYELNELNENKPKQQVKSSVTKEDIEQLEAKINVALENLMKAIKGETTKNE